MPEIKRNEQKQITLHDLLPFKICACVVMQARAAEQFVIFYSARLRFWAHFSMKLWDECLKYKSRNKIN